VSVTSEIVRADVWVWAVRLYATRSAATKACKAGHVKVNGVTAKPAQPVRSGDSIRAWTAGGERIVVVTGLIEKRTSAAIAVTNYQDLTPPAPPKPERPAPILRDPGSGRPTKRERRQVDRLRGRSG
jgi:ribosome-associated heat shock protein Hsp15